MALAIIASSPANAIASFTLVDVYDYGTHHLYEYKLTGATYSPAYTLTLEWAVYTRAPIGAPAFWTGSYANNTVIRTDMGSKAFWDLTGGNGSQFKVESQHRPGALREWNAPDGSGKVFGPSPELSTLSLLFGSGALAGIGRLRRRRVR